MQDGHGNLIRIFRPSLRSNNNNNNYLSSNVNNCLRYDPLSVNNPQVFPVLCCCCRCCCDHERLTSSPPTAQAPTPLLPPQNHMAPNCCCVHCHHPQSPAQILPENFFECRPQSLHRSLVAQPCSQKLSNKRSRSRHNRAQQCSGGSQSPDEGSEEMSQLIFCVPRQYSMSLGSVDQIGNYSSSSFCQPRSCQQYEQNFIVDPWSPQLQQTIQQQEYQHQYQQQQPQRNMVTSESQQMTSGPPYYSPGQDLVPTPIDDPIIRRQSTFSNREPISTQDLPQSQIKLISSSFLNKSEPPDSKIKPPSPLPQSKIVSLSPQTQIKPPQSQTYSGSPLPPAPPEVHGIKRTPSYLNESGPLLSQSKMESYSQSQIKPHSPSSSSSPLPRHSLLHNTITKTTILPVTQPSSRKSLLPSQFSSFKYPMENVVNSSQQISKPPPPSSSNFPVKSFTTTDKLSPSSSSSVVQNVGPSPQIGNVSMGKISSPSSMVVAMPAQKMEETGSLRDVTSTLSSKSQNGYIKLPFSSHQDMDSMPKQSKTPSINNYVTPKQSLVVSPSRTKGSSSSYQQLKTASKSKSRRQTPPPRSPTSSRPLSITQQMIKMTPKSSILQKPSIKSLTEQPQLPTSPSMVKSSTVSSLWPVQENGLTQSSTAVFTNSLIPVTKNQETELADESVQVKTSKPVKSEMTMTRVQTLDITYELLQPNSQHHQSLLPTTPVTDVRSNAVQTEEGIRQEIEQEEINNVSPEIDSNHAPQFVNGSSSPLEERSLSPVVERSSSPQLIDGSSSPLEARSNSPVEEGSINQLVERSSSPPVERSTSPFSERSSSPQLIDGSSSPLEERSTSPPVERRFSSPQFIEESTNPSVERSTSPLKEEPTSPPVERSVSPLLDRSTSPILEMPSSPIVDGDTPSSIKFAMPVKGSSEPEQRLLVESSTSINTQEQSESARQQDSNLQISNHSDDDEDGNNGAENEVDNGEEEEEELVLIEYVDMGTQTTPYYFIHDEIPRFPGQCHCNCTIRPCQCHTNQPESHIWNAQHGCNDAEKQSICVSVGKLKSTYCNQPRTRTYCCIPICQSSSNTKKSNDVPPSHSIIPMKINAYPLSPTTRANLFGGQFLPPPRSGRLGLRELLDTEDSTGTHTRRFTNQRPSDGFKDQEKEEQSYERLSSVFNKNKVDGSKSTFLRPSSLMMNTRQQYFFPTKYKEPIRGHSTYSTEVEGQTTYPLPPPTINESCKPSPPSMYVNPYRSPYGLSRSHYYPARANDENNYYDNSQSRKNHQPQPQQIYTDRKKMLRKTNNINGNKS